MKAGWKTRPAERQYLEGKLAARMERAMSLAKAEAKMQALRMANNPTNNHDRWINLANPGKTRAEIARILGIGSSTLFAKLSKYGITGL